MNVYDTLKLWEASAPEMAEELNAISGDEGELNERFYRELEFGTAGLRGILGAGTNRMNRYVVRRATRGLAKHLLTVPHAPAKGVAIAYDSRHFSDVFAKEAALTLCEYGINVYLYDSLRSVPQLSFAIGHIGCAAGIVITASHNPPEYNGYKVYWDYGGQASPEAAAAIYEQIRDCDYFTPIAVTEEEAVLTGLLHYIGAEVDEAYYTACEGMLLRPKLVRDAGASLRVVYSPLHGSGNIPVRTLLDRVGFTSVTVVPEQELPCGAFPTVKAPNPEDPHAFDLAVALAKKIDAGLAIATDPDSDRLGVAVRKSDGSFFLLTGNQIGILLLDYILKTRSENGTLPKDGYAVRSIVSTRLADAICANHGVSMFDVLTGFRFIGEKIAESERTGKGSFLFGFEESYGFLCNTFCRDKDAISSAMLLLEAALYYSTLGMTVEDALEAIYARYGRCVEQVKAYTLSGMEGLSRIAAIMSKLRSEPPTSFAGDAVIGFDDLLYSRSINADGAISPIDLPPADVLRFDLASGCYCIIRPSGTEPKLKLYAGAMGDAVSRLPELICAAESIMGL